jgi:hypothetical protein
MLPENPFAHRIGNIRDTIHSIPPLAQKRAEGGAPKVQHPNASLIDPATRAFSVMV